jgi:histidine phosphotransferase ChpT
MGLSGPQAGFVNGFLSLNFDIQGARITSSLRAHAMNRLTDLDLAALLCSRVCHDVISPVGAIANGLELMDDPDIDADMKKTALDMVKSSAKTATAKLKFCRIAFGASGSAGALIDLSEAGEVAKGFIGDEKAKLEWNVPRENRPKQEVKLLLNMLLMAIAGIPRGGVITVAVAGREFSIHAKGERAKINEALAGALNGTAELASLDARLVQPYYARLLAHAAGLELSMHMSAEDTVAVIAKPKYETAVA